jgi:hypothetical protein
MPIWGPIPTLIDILDHVASDFEGGRILGRKGI